MKNLDSFKTAICTILLLVVFSFVSFAQTEGIVYQTDFENDNGFVATTTYNNTDLAYFGNALQQWGTFYGSASTTNPITGSQSMQMRWYSGQSQNLGYIFTNFDMPNVTRVTFNAKNSDNNNVIVSYSIDGGVTYVGDQLFTLSSTADDYEYVISSIGANANVRLKFTLVLPSNPVNKSKVFIDDVVVYGMQGIAPSATAIPIASENSGLFYTPFQVTLASATENAVIYYTLDGTAPDSINGTLYSSAITIDEAMTLKAIAYSETLSASSIAEVNYNFPIALANIDAFKQLDASNDVYAIQNVTFVYRNGRNIYVKDDTGGLLIYDNNTPFITEQYVSGDLIPVIYGRKTIYNGLNELVPTHTTAASTSNVGAVMPQVVTIADFVANFADYESELVTFENVIFEAGAFTNGSATSINFTQNAASLVCRSNFKNIVFNIPAGLVANVTGFGAIYNTNPQMYPRDIQDFSPTSAVLPLNVDFSVPADQFYWTTINGTQTNKWFIGQAQGFDNNKLYISSSNGITNKYNTTVASVTHAYRDIVIPANGAVLSFDYRVMGEAADYLQVAILDDDAQLTAGTNVSSYIQRFYNQADYTHFEYNISSSMAGTKRLVFTWVNNANGGAQTPAVIDNISMIESSCVMPTDLVVTTDVDAATVTWNAPTEQTAWILEYKLANHNDWYTMNVSGAPTANLVNLQGNSNYDIRVKALCGDQESAWLAGSFNVECILSTPVSGEYTYGTGTTSETHLPFYGLYGYTYSQQIYQASEMQQVAGNITKISFYCVSAPNSSSTGNFKIWMANTDKQSFANNTDYVSPSDLTLVYEQFGTYALQVGWNEFELSTPFAYSGDNLVIAFYEGQAGYNSSSFRAHSTSTNQSLAHYSDSQTAVSYSTPASASGSKYFTKNRNNVIFAYSGMLCVDEIACVTPTQLSISNQTASTADVAWSAGANENAWILEYKQADAADWIAINVTTNSYTLTGLDRLTDYQVRVKANCDVNDESNPTDVVNFTTLATCFAPQNIYYSNSSTTTIMNWTPGGDEEHYIIEFKQVSQPDNAYVSIPVDYTTTTAFGGLTPNTAYVARIRSICDAVSDDISEWVYLYFTSGCAPMDISFEEAFTSSSIPDCWTNNGFSFQGGIAVASTIGNMLVSPALNIPENGTTYIKFEVGTAAQEANYQIALSFRGTTADDFVTIYSGTTQGTMNTPENVQIEIPQSYQGQPIYIAFVNNGFDFIGFDNLLVTQCPIVPSQLTASNVTATSVDLAWNVDGPASQFVVEYSTDGNEWTLVNVVDNPYTLTNLIPETSYSIRVASICGDNNNSKYTNIVNITTPPSCPQPIAFAVNNITDHSADLSWTAGTAETAWDIEYGPAGFASGEGTIIAVTSNSYTISELINNETYDFYVRANCGSDDFSAWVGPITALVTAVYNFPISGTTTLTTCGMTLYDDGGLTGNYSYDCDATVTVYPATSGAMITLSGTCTSESGYDELYVYDGTSTSGTLLGTFSSSNSQVGPFTSTTGPLTLNFISDGSVNYAGFELQVACLLPSNCPTPTDLVMSNITSNSAVITWNSNSATEWNIEYGPAGFEHGSGVSVSNITSPTYTFNGLLPASEYDVYVQAICNGQELSNLATTSFNTICPARMPLPYTIDFDSYQSSTTVSSSTIPDCWERQFTGTSTSYNVGIYPSSSYARSGNNSLRFYNYCSTSNQASATYGDIYALFPMFDAANPNMLRIKGWARSYSTTYSSEVIVGVVTDINDIENSFTAITTFSPTNTSYENFTIYLDGYSGENGYIAFKVERPSGSPASCYAYFDDITVELIPECYVSGLTMSNITDNSAQIAWNSNAASEWNIEYGPAGFERGSGVSVSNLTSPTYTFNGLLPVSDYDVYVQAICNGQDLSQWETISFNTICPALMPLPYTMDFDNYQSSTVVSSSTIPDCWERQFNGSSTSYNVGIYPSSSYARSGNNSLRFYNYCSTSNQASATYGDIYALFPMFDAANPNMLRIKGWSRSYNTTYSSEVIVGVVTDINDIENSFTAITTFSPTSTSYENFEISLDNYTGENGYITFKVARPSGSPSSCYAYFDDITVELIPDCEAPIDLSVDVIESDRATISWDAVDSETNFVVEYKLTNEDTWNMVSVSDFTYTIPGLIAATDYDVRVKTVCGTESSSLYTPVVSFQTPCMSGVNVTIGTGTESNENLPMYGYYGYSYSQQIYDQTEIGNVPGQISSISYYCATVPSSTSTGNIKIWLGNTTKSVFESNNDYLSPAELSLVYDFGEGNSYQFVQGWNTIQLDQPFFYNGTDNLIIAFYEGLPGYNSSAFYASATTTHKSLAHYSDTQSNVSYTSPATASGSKNYALSRSNVQFTICPNANDMAILGINSIKDACDLSGNVVNITVKNQGYDAPISSFEASYTINNGTPVTETVTFDTPLAFGEEATYQFTTLPTFAAGNNVITVTINAIGDEYIENNTLVSAPIVELAPIDIPYTENFSNVEVNHGWNVLNVNEDEVSLDIVNGKIAYTYNDSQDADDWMISPCFNLPAGKYQISYQYNAESVLPESFALYYGISDRISDLTNLVATHNFAQTSTDVLVNEVIIIAQDGVYNFGFHAQSLAGNLGFSIDNFAILPVHDVLVTYGPNGHVTPAGNVEIVDNDTQLFSIYPDEGYHIKGIYVNNELVRDEDMQNARFELFTYQSINGAAHIHVDFEISQYVVNATVSNFDVYDDYNNNALGAIFTPSVDTIMFGDSYLASIIVEPNFHIYDLTVNGTSYVSDIEEIAPNQYSFIIDRVLENKEIVLTVQIDTVAVVYNVLAGEGTIDEMFTIDASTVLPATYSHWINYNYDLLSNIVAAPGYHIESVTVNGNYLGAIQNYSFENIVATQNVDIVFAKDNITITTTAIGNGSITPGTTFEYDPAYVYNYTVTPEEGYYISSISVNGTLLTITDPNVAYNGTLTNIVDDYTIVANFQPRSYTINATAGNGGSINPVGEVLYMYHATPTYTITPAVGYSIADVTVDGISVGAVASYTFTGIETNHTIAATFTQLSVTITATAGANGTITPAGVTTLNYGASQTYAMTANTGYEIANVTVDGTSMGAIATYTFTNVTVNHTIDVTYAQIQFSVAATINGNGTITPDGITTVAYGEDQSYTITAATGYHIENVFVDGVAQGAVSTYTFSNITANHTIAAMTAVDMFTVTVLPVANGTITPGTQIVAYGSTPSFNVTPALGYDIATITVNGTPLTFTVNDAGVAVVTLPAVVADVEIAATMSVKSFTITSTASANGTITPAGTTTLNYGATQTYIITPADGYMVSNVTVDGINMGTATSFTFTNVMENHTINATFELINCVVPTNMYITNLDETSVTLNWNNVGAASYSVQYKELTASNYTLLSNITDNFVDVTGLNKGTTYIWNVKAHCSDVNASAWSYEKNFTTRDYTVIEDTVIIGIQEAELSTIRVYSNVNNIYITNESQLAIDQVYIYDAYGKLIYTGKAIENPTVISLNVATGIYMVRIETREGMQTYKVHITK